MSDVEQTLAERNSTHGDFEIQSHITQNIKRAMRDGTNFEHLPDAYKESLENMAIKIGRILAGNPNTIDSWLDISGYAELGKRHAEKSHKAHQASEES